MAFFGVPSAKAICGSEGGEDISSFDDILEALPKLVSRHESGHETLITVGRRRVYPARTAIVATAVDELLSFQEPICINHLLPPCCSGFLVPWCQLPLNAHHGSDVAKLSENGRPPRWQTPYPTIPKLQFRMLKSRPRLAPRVIDLYQRPWARSVAALSLDGCQFDNVGPEAKTRT
jgi:hypothetical protein